MSPAHAHDAPTPVRRALLSVSDKSGLIDFARALAALGIELVSTGGTAAALTKAGLPVIPVDQVTGFPEMMDGRVKTLHPHIHGAILARRADPSHQQALREHRITPIDLVCISLYPFEQTIAKPGVTREEAIEQIDIGGPAMIRAAAKNHESVTVVTDPSQYPRVLDELRANSGAISGALRRSLSQAAYARTSAYDGAISAYLARADAPAPTPTSTAPADLPDALNIRFPLQSRLRYGENPHQSAAVYRDPAHTGPSVVSARQLHGKELSYNNINDAAAALALVEDLARFAPGRCAAAIIKHANPCGAAIADSGARAVELALRGDPLAAYGGILAVATGAGALDLAGVEPLCREGVFLEVIVAGAFAPQAAERLKAKSANVRLLEVGAIGARMQGATFRSIAGGALAQTADAQTVDPGAWTLRAGSALSDDQRRAAGAVWIMAKHLASNAIAIGGADPDGKGGVRLFGAGAGQMDRVTSCRLAVEKAGDQAKGAIAASDAFFPFPDGPKLLIEAGVTTIVHPGGSKRDQETFDLCNQRGVTCLTTGVRHFRH